MDTIATIYQINVSSGGVPKTPVASALVSEMGIISDSQNDKQFHGGPDRALVIYSWEHIQALQDEGHAIYAGSTGENVTISGLAWDTLVPGIRLILGEVAAEITGYTSPCNTISHSFLDGNFNRINQKLHPGWSRLCLRVIEPGIINTGDVVSIW